jgi:hypothetical protein
MEKPAYRFDWDAGRGPLAANSLECLVDAVRIGEDVVGGFPV